MEIVIGLVVGLAIGYVVATLGRGSVRDKARETAREEMEGELEGLVQEIAGGRLPESARSSGTAKRLAEALEQGWTPKDAERRAALVAAVGRVSRFLDRQVRAPLAGADDGADPEELRERIERALGALQDVDFFLSEEADEAERADLVALAQQVSREFAADHEVTVRLSLGASSIRATVARDALMDALYLILHNASRFGGGATIDMTVLQENGKSLVRIRDRGRGFSEEASSTSYRTVVGTSATL